MYHPHLLPSTASLLSHGYFLLQFFITNELLFVKLLTLRKGKCSSFEHTKWPPILNKRKLCVLKQKKKERRRHGKEKKN